MMNSRQRILRLMPLCLATALSILPLTGPSSLHADPSQNGTSSDSSKNQDEKPKSKKNDDKSDKSDNSSSRSSRKRNNSDSDDTPRSKRNRSKDKDKDDDSKDSSSSKKKSSSKDDDDKPSRSSRSKAKSKSDSNDDSDKERSKKTASKDDSSKKDDEKKKPAGKDAKSEVAKHGDDKDEDKKKGPVKVDSGKKNVDDKKQAANQNKPEAGAKDVTESRGDHKMEPTEGEFEKHEASISGMSETHGKTEAHGKSEGPVATTSPGMQGWELVRLDGRDYVTSASLQKFYHFTQHQISGSNVELRSAVLVLQGTVGSQDLMINGIKFIMSYPVAEYNGKALFSRLDLCKLIDPVLRPSFIANSAPFDTVIIDPGHGGHDSGARGIFGYEKDYALQLGFLLKSDLERRGLKVVMTRSDDTFISLGGRVAIANNVPNSIFVALHFNSGPNTATGIETYALSPQGTSSVYGARDVDSSSFSGNTRDSENIALATAVHAMVVHHFRLVDRGVKRARWYVLTGLQRPGILFEGGFVTNEADGRLIAAENFRLELAKTIGDAIMNYRRALQPHSAAYHGR